LNRRQTLLASSLIALSLASIGRILLFRDVNASASVLTNGPAEIMQHSEANNSASNAATDIFISEQYTLSDNDKNLVILIPNEGHHGPGEDDEARFIAQSFVPETAVIKGTNVIWFNGDVGHEHDIVVSSDTNPIYQTGQFTEFEARNYDVGEFSYADTVEYDNGYIMRGNISVTDDNGSDSDLLQTMETSDTVGILMVPMVPAQDISQYTTDLQSRGFVIHSTHNFQDLRGGQSGTGDEQTLIVWRAPTNMQITSVLSQLSEFSSQLPYS
jgi:hypothetical protein